MDNERERIEALQKEATVEAATTLAELAERAESKETRKAARKALYLLGMRGIKPLPILVEAVPAAEALDTLRAYATNYDGAGNRILFFEIASPDGGKVTAVQMMTNDVTGLQVSDTSRVTRRDLHQRLHRMEELQTEGLAFVEIPADYGRWLLEESRALLRRLNKPSPAGVMELLPRIGAPRHDYLVSPIYDALTAESVRADADLDHDPAALFALHWFENWFFAVEEVLRSLEDWRQVAGESEALSEAERSAQREVIIKEVATSLFIPATRQRYVRRLEDTADVLWRIGRETDARLALYHALELGGGGAVAEVAFARLLVERTLTAGLEILKEQSAAQEE